MTNVLHDLVYVAAVMPALVVARRYRQLPRVVPISVRPNGTPFAHGPRWLLFLPALIVAVMLPLGALTLHLPGTLRSDASARLTYLLLIETALFVALILGLEAEVAVGALRRVPPPAQWIASAILIATVVLALVSA